MSKAMEELGRIKAAARAGIQALKKAVSAKTAEIGKSKQNVQRHTR